MDALLATQYHQRLRDTLDGIRSQSDDALAGEPARHLAVQRILSRVRVTKVLIEGDFHQISFEIIPVATYWIQSLIRNQLDQTTVFDKPTIVTIAEGWDDPSEPSFPLGSVPCVAIWEDGGRAGLALKGLRDAERAVPHAWDHMQPFQEQTPMVDAMNYRRQSAPGRDAGAAPQQWVTVTCPALFAGEYRRQGPAGQTGAMSEFNAVFLHEVVRALGIPIDDPELFFYLLPKTFRFYGSVFQ